jgi:hypothetical protein
MQGVAIRLLRGNLAFVRWDRTVTACNRTSFRTVAKCAKALRT